jgi:pimeloyl-ACP methyl ester carboxylesterase
MADTSSGKIAYLERGAGDAALFLHGLPLNSYQWRGAIDRLAAHRRCIAPDFLGLGYTETDKGQPLTAVAQAEMLAALLDKLSIAQVELIASDSGGAVAQHFVVKYPDRVRTMLLTNCDTEPDSPPPKVVPIIEQARAGTLADTIAGWLVDKAQARAQFGAAVFVEPGRFADETIDYYFAPLVSSPERRRQFHDYHVALEPNPLAGFEAALQRCQVPTRVVWGTGDDIFSPASPAYLDRTLPRSRGVGRGPGGQQVLPEEYPDIIAEEARRLWGVEPRSATG